jgi:hypothetical protein
MRTVPGNELGAPHEFRVTPGRHFAGVGHS